jgi:hypothetical protein
MYGADAAAVLRDGHFAASSVVAGDLRFTSVP